MTSNNYVRQNDMLNIFKLREILFVYIILLNFSQLFSTLRKRNSLQRWLPLNKCILTNYLVHFERYEVIISVSLVTYTKRRPGGFYSWNLSGLCSEWTLFLYITCIRRLNGSFMWCYSAGKDMPVRVIWRNLMRSLK